MFTSLYKNSWNHIRTMLRTFAMTPLNIITVAVELYLIYYVWLVVTADSSLTAGCLLD